MILRYVLLTLWRRRMAVVLGVLVAATAALCLSYHVRLGPPPTAESRKHQTAFASAQVLVDTRVSQVASGDDDSGTYGLAVDLTGLVTRAHLMASLMATSAFSDRIAAAAGVPRGRLVVSAPTGFGPPPGSAADPGPAPPGAIQLNLVVDESLPMIGMSAQAPDEAVARRLVEAATRVLTSSVSDAAVAHDVPVTQRLVVTPMRTVSALTVASGPKRSITAAVFLFVLGLWCLTILLLPRLADHWRSLNRDEPSEPGDADPSAEASQMRRTYEFS
jgi:hypothetical protein